jgi:predicted  nucleic acid-binding Zn-ribbon protein
MSEILDEILSLNKLIRVLIEEEDIDAIEKALAEKNKLISAFSGQENKDNYEKKFKLIKKIDDENMKNMKKLMNKTQDIIEEIKNEKGQVKKKSQKLRKYKLPNSSSGSRFDRKK